MKFDRRTSTQDLSWFLDTEEQQRLELNPPYQRNSVWKPQDRYFFLDTIFNNYPCPAIYVQKEIGSHGPVYNVVDGKQRLLTVLNFHKNKIKLPRNFSIARLSGMRFRDLDPQDAMKFYNYAFIMETLTTYGDTEWNEVFFRVNKNQKGLTEQELRHARFDGWFIKRAEKEIADSDIGSSLFWSKMKISSPAKSSRMKDVEFISILMLVVLERAFVGFPQSRIDELYAKYDFDEAGLPTEDSNMSEDPEEMELEDSQDFLFFKEDVERFEKKFTAIKSFIAEMENHNATITRHSRRLTTDFYSLWSVLALSDLINEVTPTVFAGHYDIFLNAVDEIYDRRRGERPSDASIISEDPMIAKYYTHSLGAATTAEYRQLRFEALKGYIESQVS